MGRGLIPALVMISLSWPFGAAEAQGFVTDGLVAFYTFDESDIVGNVVKDMSGNGNDAKIVGELKIVKGVIDECLLFEGKANCYVEIPPLGDWEQVTVECWAYAETLAPTYQGIVSTWQWAPGKVHFKFESRQIQVHKNDGVKIWFDCEEKKWYHIVYTTDTEKNELKLYVNGELVSQGAAGSVPENMNERRVGSEHDGRWLHGMVDEVRLYNRVLTPEEIKQNYQVTSNEMAVWPGDKLAVTWGSLKKG